MYAPAGFEASNFVSSFNTSFNLMLWISVGFIILLTAAMIWFVYKYNRKKHAKAVQIEGSIPLEITWTVIPILLALLMFHYGWTGWTPMNKAPADAINITSYGRMWSFSFLYENGKQSPDLVIPQGQAVNLKLISLDVLHSIFIPEFRLKSDMVPGREKKMWFRADREGQYDLYCAEYCGLRHSYMNAIVKVLPKEEYEKWYADSVMVVDTTVASTPGAEGLAILKANGCNACHSSDGSKIVGPSYLGVYGRERVLIRGGQTVTVTADDEYINRSIYDPNSEIVQGYPQGLMQSYKGIINDDQMAKIIEYMKSLNEK